MYLISPYRNAVLPVPRCYRKSPSLLWKVFVQELGNVVAMEVQLPTVRIIPSTCVECNCGFYLASSESLMCSLIESSLLVSSAYATHHVTVGTTIA